MTSGGSTDPATWIDAARRDVRAARRLLVDPPELETTAYHVHQAVEKAIKAFLVAAGIRYPRGRGAGHDLDMLASLVPAGDPLRTSALLMSDLTPWATAFRYPADDPLTAEPLPPKDEIERRLDAAEAFIAAVARRVAR
ncbi:HEPN domain-containing protein [Methylobacterium sp. NEAU 140]|uniref:HEPN domain-containing protein n=1 Tax=Methylobacterium sp. NEAU 140 TaxID=3064945 RepID=UPI0027375274|nr:HEPN domain-containing protein [Methylobacterium sp. NEAU 140]MDP4021330.1 HEPN domain-containing protein [Methylobacterium sp. NEAU 140]